MITTLTGQNTYLRQQKLRRLVSEFVKKQGEMAVERIDAEDVDLQTIIESMTAFSLFSNSKLVILRAPGIHKGFVDKAEQFINQSPDETDVIIVEPKLDKRTAYYKTLKKNTEFYEYSELQQPELTNWITTYAKEQQGSIGRAEADYLIKRIGGDQQLLAQEISKLIAYNPKISKETINLLTEQTPQSSVFELLDAAFAGNTRQALNLYRDQRERLVEPLAILGMMAWQLNVLAIVKTADNRTTQQIASEAKLNPFVVQKANDVARRLSLPDIKNLVSQTLNLDIRLKRESLDMDEAMCYLLLKIAND